MSIFRATAVVFLVHFLLVQIAWGETAYDRQGDEIRSGAVLFEGVIDLVNIEQDAVDSVIINDTIYHVDKDTVIRAAGGGKASLADFQAGTFVEFYAVGKQLTKVMPALKAEEPSSAGEPVKTSPSSGSNTAPVHDEGGVWKN